MSTPADPWRALARRLRRFGAAREAVAAVEFALILPVMLTMYIGSIELSQAFSMDQRVITIAGTTGDLVARSNGAIDMSTLNNYFQAAQAIMGPYDTTNLQQVVSVVAIDSKGNTSVEWSQGYHGGTPQVCNQPYGGTHPIPAAMINISKGNIVIVSEATYTYPPMLGIFFKNNFIFYHQNFYLPRYDKDIPLAGGC
jgi:Flp pilus assembly protein TadG